MLPFQPRKHMYLFYTSSEVHKSKLKKKEKKKTNKPFL